MGRIRRQSGDERFEEDDGVFMPMPDKERARSRRQNKKRRKPTNKRKKNDFHWM